jgi:hypothetical protein
MGFISWLKGLEFWGKFLLGVLFIGVVVTVITGNGDNKSCTIMHIHIIDHF